MLLGDEAADRQDEAGVRRERGLPGRAVANGLEELLLEGLHLAVDEVFLGGEVVEDRRLGDVGFAGDLGDRDLVEAPLHEEVHRGVADQLAGALLLAFPHSQLGAHAPTLPGGL